MTKIIKIETVKLSLNKFYRVILLYLKHIVTYYGQLFKIM